MKTTLDLQSIISSGGSVVVDAGRKTTLDLKSLAIAAKISGTTLILKNASRKTTLDCKVIAIAGGKGTVIFDFSE